LVTERQHRWWDRSWYISDRSPKFCALVILQTYASNQYPTQQTIDEIKTNQGYFPNYNGVLNKIHSFSAGIFVICPWKRHTTFLKNLCQLLSQPLSIV